MENIELKLYTVADLKEYFIHNRPVELLSEKVITHTRAYATIMNPYAKDDTAIVSALFVDGEVAAYTYVLPDGCSVFGGAPKIIFWNTVLHVDPKYEGRGFGFIVIGQMVEIYGENYFDLDAVEASVGNLEYAGLKISYIDQYVLDQKHIQSTTIKGKLLKTLEYVRHIIRFRRKDFINEKSKYVYSVRYVNAIDDQTYNFISDHSDGDLFLRSREMLNWIIQYPFMQESPLKNMISDKCFFGESTPMFRYYAIQIWAHNKIVGFYIMRNTYKNLYLNNIYFEDAYRELVYQSVMEHIVNFQNDTFHTADKQLSTYVSKYKYYLRTNVMHKSFAYHAGFDYDSNWKIQAGDGDNIV